jgi:hypothetical protein
MCSDRCSTCSNTGTSGCAKAIVKTGARFMVVKIRFARGAVVSRRSGKNSRIAKLCASVLTMGSITCALFGLWRIGTDLGWTGDFVIPAGLLSHWQVWMGIAMAVQYLSWQLTLYARKAARPEVSKDSPAEVLAAERAADAAASRA